MTIPVAGMAQNSDNDDGNNGGRINHVSVRTTSLMRNLRLSRSMSRTRSARQNSHSSDHRSPSPSPCASTRPTQGAAVEAQARAAVPQPESSTLEQTPLVLVRFTQKATRKLILLVEQRLAKYGILVVRKEEETDEPYRTHVYLSVQRDALETFAEQIKWMKRTNDTHVVEYFSVANRHMFVTRDAYEQGGGGDGLFTSNEWCHLTLRLLDSVEVWLQGESSSELNLMLMLKQGNEEEDDVAGPVLNRRQSFHKRQSIRLQKVEEHGKRSSCLRHVLQANEYVDVVTPLHFGPARDAIVKHTWKPWPLMPPVQEVRNYYGEDVAFYFAWMGFLSNWLVSLGIMGVLTGLWRYYRGDTIDKDEFTPFYGVFTFIWAVSFLRFWQRHEHRLAYRWGTYSLSVYEKQKFTVTRPEFKGTLRKSPVTGDYETYYPPGMRRAKYLVSAIVTMLMLSVAFTVMICSLNAQNYIHPERNPSRWGVHNPHPFHYPPVAKLSNPGNLFDATHSYKSMIPTVLHVAMIFILNNIYRRIAEKLTDWENHETEASHKNSLILKRFLFEAFDCYVALFYLAFYERDVDRLRLELVTVFNVDTFRRLSLECILPMIIQKISRKQHTHDNKGTKDGGSGTFGEESIATTTTTSKILGSIDNVFYDLADEAEKDDYDPFDDYMEIVIQFGYITLFASAYPLASLVALVANWVEIRSDCFKLAKVCRRPRSYRSDGIGVWNSLLSCVVWMSALTNCLIVGFASDQMMQIFPNFYMQDNHGDTHLVHDKGWIAVFVIFGLERLLLCIGILIHAIVPEVPEDVRDEVARLHFIRTLEHEDVMRLILRKRSSKKIA